MSSDAPPPTNDALSFTVLDWIGTSVVGSAIVGLTAFPVMAASFRASYAAFGDAALPALTDFVSRPWSAPAMAIFPLALLLTGLRPKLGLGPRRLAIVAAFILSTALLALCIYGVYLPLFEIAGAIRAE